jgi:hypothetical protein
MLIEKSARVASIAAVSIWVAALAAQSQQSPAPAPDPNRQVFRLGVELVQMDGVTQTIDFDVVPK